MATAMPIISNPRSGTRRIKFVVAAFLWLIILAAAIYYFQRDALNYLNYTEEDYGQHNWSLRFWLIPHIVGATLALFLGPTQFWSGVRHKYFRLHRWLGRFYLVGILLGGIGALRLAVGSECRLCSVPLFTLALFWLFMSAMAYVTVLRRQIDAHRQFMIRSYVLTFAFVLIRLPIRELPIFPQFENSVEARAVQEWMCWVLPLLITEFWLSWRKSLMRSKKVKT
jgi:uncharacterized membrane protein